MYQPILERALWCGILLLVSSIASAVTQNISVSAADVPTLQNSTVSFRSASGTVVPVVVEQDESDDRSGLLVIELGDADAGAGGTLLIEPNNGASPQSFTIPRGQFGSGPLQLDLLNQTLSQAPGPSNSRRSLGSSGGYGLHFGYGHGAMELEPIRTALGVSVNGTERILLSSDDELDHDDVSFGFSIPLNSEYVFWGEARDLRLSFDFQSSDGDDSGFFELQPGTDDAFIVFPDNSSVFGTGVAGGAIGGISDFDLDQEMEFYDLRLAWECVRDWPREARLFPFFGIQFGQIDQDFESNAAFGTRPDINSTLTQSSETEFYRFNIGADYQIPITGPLSFIVGGGLIYQYAETDLSTEMRFDFAGLEDTIAVDESVDSSSFGGFAKAGLNYQFNEHLSFDLTYRIETGLDTPSIRNNESGNDNFLNQLVAVPNFRSSTNHRVQGRVRARF